tara:strand:- start:526 stop:801 length:276 start_codon:yes stop_codon:yes gene_type:complete
MSRKKERAQRRQMRNISSRLNMKGSAALNKKLEEELKAPDPPHPNGFAGDFENRPEWFGSSPPHVIGGIPHEELVAQQEKDEEEEQDENTE